VTAQSDSSFAEDCGKAQSAVQQILQIAGKVRMEANRIDSSDGGLRVAQALRDARAAQADARRLLEGMAVKHREFRLQGQKLRQQKLSEDLMEAWRHAEAAEAEWARCHAERTARLAAQSQEGTDLELQIPHSNAEAPQLQLQQPGLLQLEMDDHAAQIQDRCQLSRKIYTDTRAMEGLMRDLQSHTFQQGVMTDTIEANMSGTRENMAGVAREVSATNVAQWQAAKLIYFLLVLAGILAVIIVMVTVRKHAH